MNFNPQQQPGPYPFLDEIAGKVPPPTGPVLAAIGAVGGFFYGLNHARLPLVAFVILGLIGGLLAVELLKHLTAFLITASLVAIAGLGTYWLFGNDASLRERHAPPAVQTAPANPVKSSSRGLLDDLKKAMVQP